MRKTNRLKYFAIFFILLFSGFYSLAQTAKQAQLDSLKEKLKKDSAWIFRYRKVAPLIGFDNRNTFIQNNAPVNLQGIQLGVVLYERHSLAIGAYEIRASSKKAARKGDKNKTEKVSLDLRYITLFYQYNFVNTRWWQIGIPIEVGVGKFSISVTDSVNHLLKGYPFTRGMTPVGIGLDVTFFPLTWLGLNVTGGYRKVFDNEPRLNFSGAFYSYGVAVDFGFFLHKTFYYFKKNKYRKNVRKINEKAS
ncbi:MAG TPA: hypothetical protein VNZ49_14560 [Bacteroidia bacterium]|jgi:hypothetical protein|nr:hypothetical protein [Bacteroidia bacterium]